VLSVCSSCSAFRAILAATRVAHADSWWARRYYDDEKLSKARDRYRSGSQISNALTL
jgi:hypothetical protein